MSQQLLIVGSGFAGMMSALGAARLRDEKGVSPEDLSITVISPEPSLVIRPRLYERNPEAMVAPLADLFAATEIDHCAGSVEAIDYRARTVTVADAEGGRAVRSYDRLVLAAGSQGFQPPVPGLAEFGHSTTQLDDAVALDRHLHALAARPDTPARNTVVVAGAGFTGLEVATELPGRLAEILGNDAAVRIVVADRGKLLAPDMGDEARGYIEARLRQLGIELRLGAGIVGLDEHGVMLDNGERIEAATVVWSAGMRASPLTAQLPGERDNLGRIVVEPDLRVPGAPEIFATGDTAKAACDNLGHFALMSCQHARRLGAFSGHNAAADLLGEPTLPYDQPSYVVCLDLGPDTAVFTRGWERHLEITGAPGKDVKTEINTVWIYPPAPTPAAAYENVLHARTVDF